MQNHRWSITAYVTLWLLLSTVPLSALQQSPADTVYMTLEQARTEALRANPSFRGEVERIGAAEGAVREAGSFRFNPEAEAEFPGSLNGADPGGYEILVSQRLEWAGQRGLRVEAARAGLEGAGSTSAEAGRVLLRDVTEAYFLGLATERRLNLAEGIHVLNERLLDAVEVQLDEGEISVMEANFAQIEAARSLARVLVARREARSASLTLGRLVGAPAGTLVRTVEVSPEGLADPDRLDVETLTAAALARRPDLAARRQYLAQAETLARLARREAIPEVGVGALVTGGEAEPSTRVGLQVSVPLPLWNRNQGLVSQRNADARRVRLELDAVELAVRTEVADAYQTYVAACEEETLFLQRVLEPARRNQQLLDAAYREGQIDLPALVLLRNQLFDAEVGYWDAWLARRRSLTRLRAAVGEFETDLEEL